MCKIGFCLLYKRALSLCVSWQVNAPFKIERVKEPFLSEQVFFCDVTQAVVPASGKSVIPLRFSPQTVGVECVDYFTIMPVGNVTHSVLKVTGTGKGKRQQKSFLHLPTAIKHAC